MKLFRHPPIVTSLKPSNHPYLTGAWTPLHEEVDAEDLEVIEGAVPTDIAGMYIRNTENQVHQPLGRHHPFDGDAMLHRIEFSGGRVRYGNRFVRTRCFAAEQEAGESLWGGLADPVSAAKRPGFGAHGAIKDSASTDVVVHAGKILATFYQCGEAYQIDPDTLEDLGVAPWAPIDGVSAHCKVDETTGELLFFNYSKHPPYMHYGVVGADGRLKSYVPIALPGPRLPHDMAFTEHYSILNDLPTFWDERLLERDIHAVRFHESLPSRFAVIPRHGGVEDIRWFEAAPCYALHFVNAYEDGDEIVVDGYFQEEPTPAPLSEGAVEGHEHLMAYLDMHSFKSRLHRWRFNLKTGETVEQRLSDRIVEFGMMNARHAGKPYRYVYSVTAKPGWFLFNGFVKHDLHTGETTELMLEEGRYASEAPFAPRIGAVDEDDGYLVSFVIDENRGTSECVLIDAKELAAGPVCRIALPHKISSGTHSVWADRSFIETGRAV
jgi:carotenoid cleavage dioxygenase-like enzyme